MFLLYKLTFSSNKSYIGQTNRTLHTRILQHKRSVKANSALAVHLAWAKYGQPVIETIGEYETQEELHQAEILAIQQYNTLTPFGYNLALGGETAPSKNPDVAAKISQKAKGRKMKADVVAKMGETTKELWKNEDYRAKVITKLKEAWTDEMRQKRSEMVKAVWAKKKLEGFVVAESTKEKHRNKIVSQETRDKMSKAALGKPKKPKTQETKDKIAANTKRQWESKQFREHFTAKVKETWAQKTSS